MVWVYACSCYISLLYGATYAIQKCVYFHLRPCDTCFCDGVITEILLSAKRHWNYKRSRAHRIFRVGKSMMLLNFAHCIKKNQISHCLVRDRYLHAICPNVCRFLFSEFGQYVLFVAFPFLNLYRFSTYTAAYINEYYISLYLLL